MSAKNETGWQPIKTVPRDHQPLRFRTAAGEEFDGQWSPYWCGEDCPCDVAGEGIEPFTYEPECWCAYKEGHEIGEHVSPTHWKRRSLP
jgi:hypothetical protein